ncbi:MAG: hypothetical protein IPN69_19915 [Acidobacteria bacterium]|nr:hypothetical protein [Acidobacteriota bacterium]MBK8812977.1 hypothetical protein [Acidobacteriota bacterium]
MSFLRFSAPMVVGIVLAVAALAQDPGKPSEKRDDRREIAPVVRVKPTPTPTNAKKTTLLFPEIEGWTMSPKQTYPTPELGYSYTYESNGGGRVTIYVYNGGNRKIADDINDAIVLREYKGVREEILAVGKAGIYQNMKEVKTGTATVGDSIESHYARYEFSVQGQRKVSELYLFSFENNFIKIRATRNPDQLESSEFKDLMKELAAIFAP